MARPLRIEYPGAWYHVTCRGNQKIKIFEDDRDRRRFLEALAESIGVFNVEVHCYVLMSNHFHFLLKTPEANLSRFMQRFNTAYITYYNLRHQKSGHLYQGRYKAILVEEDRYLLGLSRYIHLNPIRTKKYHGLPIEEKVKILKEYRWSSLLGYLKLNSRNNFLHYNMVLGYLGGDTKRGRRRFRDFIFKGLEEDSKSPLSETRASSILGSDNFITWVKEQFLDGKVWKEKDHPQIKALKKSIPIEKIARAVAEDYGLKPEEILKPRSRFREARQVLIELSYQLNFKKRSLQELGRGLGDIGGDSIAHNHKRIQYKMEKDRRLFQKVARLSDKLLSQ